MLSGINPFKVRGKSNSQRLKMITDEPIPMMPMFTPVARTIIESLLEKDVSPPNSLKMCSRLNDLEVDLPVSMKSKTMPFSETLIGT